MQHQLLLAIRGHRGAAGPTISDVAGYLIVRHHSAVQLVDRAEAGRLVHRVPDERDGRVVRLALSREGARRLEALAAATKEELARVGPRLAGLWTPSMSRRFRPHVLSGIRTRLLRLRDTGYLKKWLILGGLIGIVAGLGAVVFITALEAATGLFLESLGGYTPPSPIGEGNAAGSAGFDRPWAIPLVVALGGLISGILTVRFAPEAEGHGTDAAIEAFHHNPGGVRSRVVGVKLAASAITIGSEGSAGREGPTAQISAGFGSLLGRVLELSPTDARIAVARRHRLGHRRHLPGPAGRRGARR